MTTQRLRLVRDDDGHWYIIPADKRNAFNEWLGSFDEWGCPNPKLEAFDDYILGMHPSNYTFTDLREDFK